MSSLGNQWKWNTESLRRIKGRKRKHPLLCKCIFHRSKVGENNPQFGKKGKLSANYGKKRTEKTRIKQSISARAAWKIPKIIRKHKLAASISNIRSPRGFALKTIYSDTQIELLLEKELQKLGFRRNKDYYKNKNIKNIANVDFYFPKQKTIIEADGCYFHYCRKCKKGDKNTFERIKIDEKKTKKLKSLGYVVFRFWEHDIKSNPIKLINKILKKWKQK